MNSPNKNVELQTVTIDNQQYFKISNSDAMRPFFMSIVSNSNHWMFISSNGGLTAGRKNAENALFPYYTDDKITESADITGSKTIVQIHKETKILLWEPFSDKYEGIYSITRNLYKNSYGNKIIFEEINEDLRLIFRYHWNTSNEYGFVRKSELINNSDAKVEVTILDGIQNIIPYGVTSAIQEIRSNLVDAYKKSELETSTGIGIYALSAIIVDKAEPSEALKANLVWSLGVKNPTYLISSKQLTNFRRGEKIEQEIDVKAEKGAYFTIQNLSFKPKEEKSWYLIANVNQNLSSYHSLAHQIKNKSNLLTLLQKSIDEGTDNLIELVGASDGLQLGNIELRNTRHFANTLFNIMRGGIFDNNYQIEKQDFEKYLKNANQQVFKNQKNTINNLPQEFTVNYLKNRAITNEDKDFKRLCFEYLPLKFSRRHGDPSRPWNRFSINTRSEIDGAKILDYEGNWRDIFQNWEALAHSYPEFIEGMIFKFLNASTFDGYNPYRVTKGGFDWEIIEPDDPWSYIGYWGDHQIIYLLKFLEFIEDYYPGRLSKNFTEAIFVYAKVPYKIKNYQETLQNPKDTIDFDEKLNHKIDELRAQIGADGALLRDANNRIYRVNMMEKLLATVLAKISNFIPEAGIWMNTQRPEWNDANNALVGNGVSMVTLCYLHRFIDFFENVVANTNLDNIAISNELVTFFNAVVASLKENENILSKKISNADRKTVLDGVGTAGSNYRLSIYKNGFQNKKTTISKNDLLDFFSITKKYTQQTIDANKRDDNMYHAYNLMTVENKKEVSISYLSEMLEGQVAVLSSGHLSAKQALATLDGLKASALFREDQYSYILYPNKDLGRFIDKNNIPKKAVQKSKLLQQLLADGNHQIINKDVAGNYHFNGNFNNADVLKRGLENLSKKYQSLVHQEENLLLEIYEEMFDHKSFTGRSGTFFGYEGLGSIYWHMVSKLLLAVQENCLLAINNNESEEVIGRLLDHYYEINEGIGVHKSPELYGAFPTDPYSHTPATKGAQQPGMTGQVKEDILSRMGELGAFVKNGKVTFNPRLLRKEEFLTTSKTFNYVNVKGKNKTIVLEKNTLCFTYCQVPIVYKLSDKNKLKIFYTDGKNDAVNDLKIDQKNSNKLFKRTGEIKKIIVFIEK
ncbi:hypothetical protein JL193_04105 [Polaribacter batillariae]|uniref:Cellobiose phosphorylase n=1 Tax=Polaribacter batillariae TaxID=2808900 RepID=A0ABX7T192_9FLAO|nr:hypothetical protein [Polaribacter batillariae]QTD39270.1 hypothetical protein JL193_04105 [Polaribacter batillariae]